MRKPRHSIPGAAPTTPTPSVPSMRKWAAASPPSDPSNSQPTNTLPRPEDVSYSALARVSPMQPSTPFLDDDLPTVAQLPSPTQLSRHHSVHADRVLPPPPTADLVRSDSLLNRARRVFSLPTTLKRRTATTRPPIVTAPVETPMTARPPKPQVQQQPPGSLGFRRAREDNPTNPAAAAANVTPGVERRARSQTTVGTEDRRVVLLEERIKVLEGQLEGSRMRVARQKKRISQLEEEGEQCRQAVPALETMIKSALAQFEAKEIALRRTIEKVDQQYKVAVAEKNEAMRLLNAFVGRSGRGVLESGMDIGFREQRRALSLDAFRKNGNSVPPNMRNNEGDPQLQDRIIDG